MVKEAIATMQDITFESDLFSQHGFLILGGTNNTGKLLVERLHQMGARDIVVAGRNDERGQFHRKQDLLKGIAKQLPLDFIDTSGSIRAIEDMIKRGGRITRVVNLISAGLDSMMYDFIKKREKSIIAAHATTEEEIRRATFGLLKELSTKYLEKTKKINTDTPNALLDHLPSILPPESIYIFTSSLLSTFFREGNVHPIYRNTASTKKQHEDYLNAKGDYLAAQGIYTAIVSGDLLSDTQAAKDLGKYGEKAPEVVISIPLQHTLPTMDDMVNGIVNVFSSNPREWSSYPRYEYVIGPNNITRDRNNALKVAQMYMINGL